MKRVVKSVRRTPAVSSKREQAAPNALAMLKDDHKMLKGLFEKFEKMKGRTTGKKALVSKIIKELCVHTSIEEKVFYPAMRQRIRRAKEEILESFEEHYVMEWLMAELDRMEPTAERFDAKMYVMMETCRRHIKEEESKLFPMAREEFSATELRALGARLMMAKKRASTRPQPRKNDMDNPMTKRQTRQARVGQNGTTRRGRAAMPTAGRRTRPEMHARH